MIRNSFVLLKRDLCRILISHLWHFILKSVLFCIRAPTPALNHTHYVCRYHSSLTATKQKVKYENGELKRWEREMFYVNDGISVSLLRSQKRTDWILKGAVFRIFKKEAVHQSPSLSLSIKKRLKKNKKWKDTNRYIATVALALDPETTPSVHMCDTDLTNKQQKF